MQLLQITEAYAPAFSARLADQIFSIVLLVGFAIYSVREQSKTNNKLDKYIEEDRKEMLEVIKNNTEALKIINTKMLTSILLLVFMLSTLYSCSSLKKTNKTLSSTETGSTENLSQEDSSSYELTETKSSIVGIPEKKLSGTLAGDALKPVYNDKGEAKPNTTTFKGKGLSMSATAKPDGSIDLNANCDSITLINEGLRRELKRLKNSTASKTVETVKYVQVVSKEKIKRGFSWFAFSIGVLSTAIFVWLSNKFQFLSIIKKIVS